MKEDKYNGVLGVECPYANCGAGKGNKCLVHHNSGAPTIRDSPHVSRVKKADPDTDDNLQEFVNELKQE